MHRSLHRCRLLHCGLAREAERVACRSGSGNKERDETTSSGSLPEVKTSSPSSPVRACTYPTYQPTYLYKLDKTSCRGKKKALSLGRDRNESRDSAGAGDWPPLRRRKGRTWPLLSTVFPSRRRERVLTGLNLVVTRNEGTRSARGAAKRDTRPEISAGNANMPLGRSDWNAAVFILHQTASERKGSKVGLIITLQDSRFNYSELAGHRMIVT